MSTSAGTGEGAKPAGPKAPTPAVQPEVDAPAIMRQELEVVIRRAVELSLAERDSEEGLSEDEVLRVAAEVGLPARLARQALYERPLLSAQPSRFEDTFGNPIVTASRVITEPPDKLRRRLEDYFATYEYLQVVRRRSTQTALAPAEDTISSIARGLLRPSSRFQVSRAKRVVLSVRGLDEDQAHVQIATDFDAQRRESIKGSFLGGTAVGVVVGAGAAVLTAVAGVPGIPAPLPEMVAFAGGFSATLWGMVRLVGRSFRNRMRDAKIELEGLLDRAEHADRLEPPPSPWKRRLQARFRL